MMLTKDQKIELGVGVGVLGGLTYYYYTKSRQVTHPVSTVTRTIRTTQVHTAGHTVNHTVGRTVRQTSGQTVSHTPNRQTTTKRITTAQSPYGNNPSHTPRNCPSGYQPVYHSTYGWVCQETTAHMINNLKASYALSGCSTGLGFSTSGVAVGGLSPYQQAQLALATLQGRCGGSWGIYWQQGRYLIIPVSRLRYLLATGAGDIYTVNSGGGPGTIVMQTPRSVSQYAPPQRSVSRTSVQTTPAKTPVQTPGKATVTFYETAGPCINGMSTVTRHYSDGRTTTFQSVCIG